ncbi:MAG: DUF6496 domain-containing protein [Chitinophagaceae bacterium]
MAKYSKGAAMKVEKTMHEMKEGKLKTGTGKKVTSRKQAIAIGLSEAREEGEKVPKDSVNHRRETKSASKKSEGKSSSKTKSKMSSSGGGTSKSGSTKRGLAAASKAPRKRVASKGGKSWN